MIVSMTGFGDATAERDGTHYAVELRSLNDDIVQLANQVVDIDEQSHWRLDLIKTRTSAELQTLNKGSRALKGYERGIGGGPSMQCLS